MTIELTLSFNKPVDSEKHCQEIMENVLKALEDGYNGHGLAPDDSEIVTESIKISGPYGIELDSLL